MICNVLELELQFSCTKLYHMFQFVVCSCTANVVFSIYTINTTWNTSWFRIETLKKKTKEKLNFKLTNILQIEFAEEVTNNWMVLLNQEPIFFINRELLQRMAVCSWNVKYN